MFYSVIIPLYNKEGFILRAINSVLSQAFTDFELIIVNDGSTDNSKQIAESIVDNRIKIFNKKNEGVSSARNFGIDKAKGEWIAFLDADDFWEMEFLDTIFQQINKFRSYNFFFSNHSINNNIKIFSKIEDSFIVNDYYLNKKLRLIPHSSCSVVRKKVFQEIGNFNTKISIGEDTDMWYRILWKYRGVCVTKKLSNVFIGDSNWQNYSDETSYWLYTYFNWIKNCIIVEEKVKDFKPLINKEIIKFYLNQSIFMDKFEIDFLKKRITFIKFINAFINVLFLDYKFTVRLLYNKFMKNV